jgi:hypothetical protein
MALTEDGGFAAVRGGKGQVRVAIAIDGHAIARPGKVLGREPGPDGPVLDVRPAQCSAARTTSDHDGVVMVRHVVTVACDFPVCLTRQG